MSQKVGLNEQDCDNLPMGGIAETLRTSDLLDIEISRAQGQVVSLIDEAEKSLEMKLREIRHLRLNIKEKQRRKRELTAICGNQAAQLFNPSRA